MNYIKGLFITIAIATALLMAQGCGKPEANKYLKVNEMFSNLKSYTVEAEIIVRGNLLVESYVVKQYFKYPDRYRLEALSPGDKKGKITLYDGEKLYIYHPGIAQIYILENYREVEESSMFPGYFAKNLFSGEDAVYSTVQDGSNQYISIKVGMPGGNSYRKWQVLYVDGSTIKPVKMELLDKDGNVVVTIIYRNFSYNEKIDEKLFTRDSIPNADKTTN